jgi:pyruvate/2-oxoglutarate dehydrogenase complex dihydrolipoamide acyltransferase (E2) component
VSDVEVRVPDIGDFAGVPVIEILVKAGDTVAVEDPLITLESDKATMDVPSPVAGTVKQLAVKLGDKVAEGSVLLTLEADQPESSEQKPPEPDDAGDKEAPAEAAPKPEAAGSSRDTQVLVIGSRPSWSSATRGWAASA